MLSLHFYLIFLLLVGPAFRYSLAIWGTVLLESVTHPPSLPPSLVGPAFQHSFGHLGYCPLRRVEATQCHQGF